jgi:tetratricopeptide (TPR) repeat protein
MSGAFSVTVRECPMCGAPVDPKLRDCGHCGSALVIISNDGIFSRELDMKVLDGSLAKWKEKLRAFPDDPVANYAIGMIYLNKNLRDSAIAYLRKATLYGPESALAHYNLSLALFDDGRALLNSQEFRESVKEMEYAESLDPEFIEAQAFRHFYLARKLQAVDANEAINEYHEAINLCSDISVFYNNMGLCYSKVGNYAEAEKAYNSATEIDDTSAVAYSNLCALYFKTEHYSAGVEFGEYGVMVLKSSDPDHIKGDLYNNYALCLWKVGRTKEALSNIKKAIAYQPGNPLYAQNLRVINSGCFIATATMGSYDHPVVLELRALRDKWILKKVWGEQFVAAYYKISPKYAAMIERRTILKRLSFCFIVLPLYCVSKLISMGQDGQK